MRMAVPAIDPIFSDQPMKFLEMVLLPCAVREAAVDKKACSGGAPAGCRLS